MLGDAQKALNAWNNFRNSSDYNDGLISVQFVYQMAYLQGRIDLTKEQTEEVKARTI